MDKPEDCVICLSKLLEDKPLHCGHWIHISCIQQQFKSECPLCRKPLSIQVFGSRPESDSSLYSNVHESESEETFIGHVIVQEVVSMDWCESDDERDLDSWISKGYSWPDEDDEYDEENPFGDSWYYEEED